MLRTSQLIRLVVGMLVVAEALVFFAGWGSDTFTGVILVGLWLASGGTLLVTELMTWRVGELPRAGAVLVTVALVVDAGGNMLGWYEKFFWYDLMVHGVSGAVLSIVFVMFLEKLDQKHRWGVPRMGLEYVAVASAVLAGVGFEVMEWALDGVFASEQWLGGGADTVTDLLSGLTGAVVGVLLWPNTKITAGLDRDKR